MQEITYRTATVCAVSKLEASTLRTWKARGVLPVHSEGDGWTRYTFEDLVAIDTMARLATKYAISNEQACRIAKYVAAIASGRARVVRAKQGGMSQLAAGYRYVVIRGGDADFVSMPEAGIAFILGAANEEGDAIIIDAQRAGERVREKLRELDEEVPETKS